MTRLRKMKGFTLIELIVVVIIIGVLAAIAAVAYNKFVGNSKKAAAQATAKNVAQKISAEAANSSDGDSAVYAKAQTVSGLATAVGVPSTIFLKDAAGAALADADLAAVITTAPAYGSSIYVGDAAHNCQLLLKETVTLGTCK